MAREQIDPNDGGSRMAAVFATPPSGQTTHNGSAGENTISWDVRDTTDSAAYEPADYVGDGHITPSYPHVWLLLTRQTSVSAAGTNDFFSAYSSTNKTNWRRVGGFNPVAPERTPLSRQWSMWGCVPRRGGRTVSPITMPLSRWSMKTLAITPTTFS